MVSLDPLAGIVGGVLIGLATTLLLANNGRLAGVSGAVHGLFTSASGELRWRAWFLAGLVLAGVVCSAHAVATPRAALGRLALGGLLVGLGTRMGNGCTSGHGVCGLGNRSKRSFVAVLVFMATAIVATFVMRHVLGVAA